MAALAAVVGTCSALCWASPALAVPTTRVVAPGATRTIEPCTTATPCNFLYAINSSVAGDDVQFESGQYDYDGSVHTTLQYVPLGVTLHPAADATSRPLIKQTVGYPVCNCPVLGVQSGDVIEGLAVDQSVVGPNGGAGAIDLADDATADRDVFTGLNGMYFISGNGGPHGVLRDSLVISTGFRAVGVVPGVTAYLENVTAIARGAFGTALEADGASGLPATLNVLNTIARGDQYDAVANASAGATAQVSLDHSDTRLANQHLAASGGGAPAISDLSPQRGDPLFASLTDFHELAGSPTIDTGTPAGLTSAVDLDGHPRTLGSAPDIGAYEFQPPPATPPGSSGARAAALKKCKHKHSKKKRKKCRKKAKRLPL